MMFRKEAWYLFFGFYFIQNFINSKFFNHKDSIDFPNNKIYGLF